ncbi:MAG: Membrane-associated phospholipid phosphatase [Ignavibacteriae bacterium]|nr:MAG: Membrane-associated phospholipid phosphatase [Ignavibacteriota bacterium]
MKKIFLKIFFISLIISQNLFAQHTDTSKFTFNKWIKNYPSHFYRGFEYGFLKENKPLTLISNSILVLTLSRFDNDISQKFRNKPFLSDDISNIADSYGKTLGWGYFAGVGFITLEGIIHKDKFEEYFFKIERVMESIAMTQLITQTLKMTTFRERPNRNDNHSFPSGHTSSSFALAASLDGLYGINVGLPAYIFATIVGLQRINSNSHYLSDVLAGAMIGVFVGNGFSNLHSTMSSKTQTVRIIPNFDPENLSSGLLIRIDF